MQRKKVKIFVDGLRKQHGLNTIPINVKNLTSNLGVEIRYEDFSEILSGFVYQKHGSKFIGINSSEGEERQRFTIAHELGHLFLHRQNPVNYDQGVMMFRDGHSSDGTDIREIDANQFAAELLMPEDLLRVDLAKIGKIDLIDDSEKTKLIVSKLAEKYKVSLQAMTIRLSSLYFS